MLPQEPKIIKTIVPVNCPECNKQIFVSFQMMIPSVCSLITPAQIKEAKEDAANRINEIKFNDPKEKENWLAYVNNVETLFEPADVDSIIKQILQANDNAKKDTTK